MNGALSSHPARFSPAGGLVRTFALVRGAVAARGAATVDVVVIEVS
jgi:hypothetical protein